MLQKENDEAIIFDVIDWDRLSAHDFIGRAILEIADLVDDELHECLLPLRDKKMEEDISKARGFLKVKVLLSRKKHGSGEYTGH